MLTVGCTGRLSVRALPNCPSRAIAHNLTPSKTHQGWPKQRYAKNERPAWRADIRPRTKLHLSTLAASNSRESFPAYQSPYGQCTEFLPPVSTRNSTKEMSNRLNSHLESLVCSDSLFGHIRGGAAIADRAADRSAVAVRPRAETGQALVIAPWRCGCPLSPHAGGADLHVPGEPRAPLSISTGSPTSSFRLRPTTWGSSPKSSCCFARPTVNWSCKSRCGWTTEVWRSFTDTVCSTTPSAVRTRAEFDTTISLILTRCDHWPR